MQKEFLALISFNSKNSFTKRSNNHNGPLNRHLSGKIFDSLTMILRSPSYLILIKFNNTENQWNFPTRKSNHSILYKFHQIKCTCDWIQYTEKSSNLFAFPLDWGRSQHSPKRCRAPFYAHPKHSIRLIVQQNTTCRTWNVRKHKYKYLILSFSRYRDARNIRFSPPFIDALYFDTENIKYISEAKRGKCERPEISNLSFWIFYSLLFLIINQPESSLLFVSC